MKAKRKGPESPPQKLGIVGVSSEYKSTTEPPTKKELFNRLTSNEIKARRQRIEIAVARLRLLQQLIIIAEAHDMPTDELCSHRIDIEKKLIGDLEHETKTSTQNRARRSRALGK